MIRIFLLMIAFNFILIAGFSQSNSLEVLKKQIRKIDSLVTNCKKEGTLLFDFDGVIDSSWGKIKGTIFLSENKKDIKYVQIHPVNEKNLIEYYCVSNEVMLIITTTYFYFKEGSFSFLLTNTEKLQEEEPSFNFQLHSDYFKSLKIIANIY